MLANDAFHIAVLAGDGIEARGDGARARGAAPDRGDHVGTEIPLQRGAGRRRALSRHPQSLPESTVKLCEEADAILAAPAAAPHIRYPDDTEIMPQVELRFIFDLYAGVRPARLGHLRPDCRRRRARHRSGGDP